MPDAPWFLLFVLGRYSAGQVSCPLDLLPFVAAHTAANTAAHTAANTAAQADPEPWAMCAFGAAEHACAMTAAALGGHVRVGFENNLRLKDGALAPDNAALVAQAADIARCLGRPLATAHDVRQRFGAA